jgi:nitroreductase
MSFLEQLEWRYACKKFDAEKHVSEQALNKILTSIQLAPTSYGMQPFHVTVISDPLIKQRLKPKAMNQAQIDTCSHLLVFSARTDVLQRLKDYFKNAKDKNAFEKESLKFRSKFMFAALIKKCIFLQVKSWATNQAYIALGFALAACAELQIDSCPIEGFLPLEFKKELALPRNFYPVVCLAIGYRADSPRIKFPFPMDDLFDRR